MTSTKNDAPEQRTDEKRDQRIREAGQRALREAAERRRGSEQTGGQPRPIEKGGQTGPDPARYGDWEKDGIVSDF